MIHLLVLVVVLTKVFPTTAYQIHGRANHPGMQQPFLRSLTKDISTVETETDVRKALNNTGIESKSKEPLAVSEKCLTCLKHTNGTCTVECYDELTKGLTEEEKRTLFVKREHQPEIPMKYTDISDYRNKVDYSNPSSGGSVSNGRVLERSGKVDNPLKNALIIKKVNHKRCADARLRSNNEMLGATLNSGGGNPPCCGLLERLLQGVSRLNAQCGCAKSNLEMQRLLDLYNRNTGQIGSKTYEDEVPDGDFVESQSNNAPMKNRLGEGRPVLKSRPVDLKLRNRNKGITCESCRNIRLSKQPATTELVTPQSVTTNPVDSDDYHTDKPDLSVTRNDPELVLSDSRHVENNNETKYGTESPELSTTQQINEQDVLEESRSNDEQTDDLDLTPQGTEINSATLPFHVTEEAVPSGEQEIRDFKDTPDLSSSNTINEAPVQFSTTVNQFTFNEYSNENARAENPEFTLVTTELPISNKDSQKLIEEESSQEPQLYSIVSEIGKDVDPEQAVTEPEVLFVPIDREINFNSEDLVKDFEVGSEMATTEGIQNISMDSTLSKQGNEQYNLEGIQLGSTTIASARSDEAYDATTDIPDLSARQLEITTISDTETTMVPLGFDRNLAEGLKLDDDSDEGSTESYLKIKEKKIIEETILKHIYKKKSNNTVIKYITSRKHTHENETVFSNNKMQLIQNSNGRQLENNEEKENESNVIDKMNESTLPVIQEFSGKTEEYGTNLQDDFGEKSNLNLGEAETEDIGIRNYDNENISSEDGGEDNEEEDEEYQRRDYKDENTNDRSNSDDYYYDDDYKENTDNDDERSASEPTIPGLEGYEESDIFDKPVAPTNFMNIAIENDSTEIPVTRVNIDDNEVNKILHDISEKHETPNSDYFNPENRSDNFSEEIKTKEDDQLDKTSLIERNATEEQELEIWNEIPQESAYDLPVQILIPSQENLTNHLENSEDMATDLIPRNTNLELGDTESFTESIPGLEKGFISENEISGEVNFDEPLETVSQIQNNNTWPNVAETSSPELPISENEVIQPVPFQHITDASELGEENRKDMSVNPTQDSFYFRTVEVPISSTTIPNQFEDSFIPLEESEITPLTAKTSDPERVREVIMEYSTIANDYHSSNEEVPTGKNSEINVPEYTQYISDSSELTTHNPLTTAEIEQRIGDGYFSALEDEGKIDYKSNDGEISVLSTETLQPLVDYLAGSEKSSMERSYTTLYPDLDYQNNVFKAEDDLQNVNEPVQNKQHQDDQQNHLYNDIAALENAIENLNEDLEKEAEVQDIPLLSNPEVHEDLKEIKEYLTTSTATYPDLQSDLEDIKYISIGNDRKSLYPDVANQVKTEEIQPRMNGDSDDVTNNGRQDSNNEWTTFTPLVTEFRNHDDRVSDIIVSPFLTKNDENKDSKQELSYSTTSSPLGEFILNNFTEVMPEIVYNPVTESTEIPIDIMKLEKQDSSPEEIIANSIDNPGDKKEIENNEGSEEEIQKIDMQENYLHSDKEDLNNKSTWNEDELFKPVQGIVEDKLTHTTIPFSNEYISHSTLLNLTTEQTTKTNEIKEDSVTPKGDTMTEGYPTTPIPDKGSFTFPQELLEENEIPHVEGDDVITDLSKETQPRILGEEEQIDNLISTENPVTNLHQHIPTTEEYIYSITNPDEDTYRIPLENLFKKELEPFISTKEPEENTELFQPKDLRENEVDVLPDSLLEGDLSLPKEAEENKFEIIEQQTTTENYLPTEILPINLSPLHLQEQKIRENDDWINSSPQKTEETQLQNSNELSNELASNEEYQGSICLPAKISLSKVSVNDNPNVFFVDNSGRKIPLQVRTHNSANPMNIQLNLSPKGNGGKFSRSSNGNSGRRATNHHKSSRLFKRMDGERSTNSNFYEIIKSSRVNNNEDRNKRENNYINNLNTIEKESFLDSTTPVLEYQETSSNNEDITQQTNTENYKLEEEMISDPQPSKNYPRNIKEMPDDFDEDFETVMNKMKKKKSLNSGKHGRRRSSGVPSFERDQFGEYPIKVDKQIYKRFLNVYNDENEPCNTHETAERRTKKSLNSRNKAAGGGNLIHNIYSLIKDWV